VLIFQTTAFRRPDYISVFRWNQLSWAQSIELVPISWHQHQHELGYINQAQYKPSARVKTNVNKELHTYEALHQRIIRIEVIIGEIISLNGTKIKKQIFPLSLHLSDFWCNSGSVDGRDVQVTLIDRMVYQRHMANSLYFLYVVWEICVFYVGTIQRIYLSSEDICSDRTPLLGFVCVCVCVCVCVWNVCLNCRRRFVLSCVGAAVRRQTSSIALVQLSRFHLKTETESSLRNVVF
jgi:hypothetical protein